MPHVEDDENRQNVPSLVWTIKTAFTNYQNIIDKHETLLRETIVLNSAIVEKLGDLNNRLEKIPDKYILSNADGKLSQISNKLTRAIYIVTIVGGIGIGTYVWVNHQIDTRIKQILKQTTYEVINSRPEQLQPGGRLYFIDNQGNKIPILVERDKTPENNSQTKP